MIPSDQDREKTPMLAPKNMQMPKGYVYRPETQTETDRSNHSLIRPVPSRTIHTNSLPFNQVHH
jgi:hypothetical protein